MKLENILLKIYHLFFYHSYRKIFEGSHGFLNIWTVRMIILKTMEKTYIKSSVLAKLILKMLEA